jgi:hypothetical protein
MTRMRIVFLLAGAALLTQAAAAQAPPAGVQNLNLRRAVQAYGSADFTRTLTFARQALRERLTAPDRARAYELLGFVFGATGQPDSCIAAFREMILLDPDRELGRVGPHQRLFQAALSQAGGAPAAGGRCGSWRVRIRPHPLHRTSSARVRPSRSAARPPC